MIPLSRKDIPPVLASTRLDSQRDSLVWIAEEQPDVRLRMQHLFGQHGLTASAVDSLELLAPKIGQTTHRPAILVISANELAVVIEAARQSRAAGFSGQLLCSCAGAGESAAETARAAGVDALTERPIPTAVVAALARSFGLPAQG